MSKKTLAVLILCGVILSVMFSFLGNPDKLPFNVNNMTPSSKSSAPQAEFNAQQLKACINRVNNSEAQQVVIQQALDDCNKKYSN